MDAWSRFFPALAAAAYGVALLAIGMLIVLVVRPRKLTSRIGILAICLGLGFAPFVAFALLGRSWLELLGPAGDAGGGTELTYDWSDGEVRREVRERDLEILKTRASILEPGGVSVSRVDGNRFAIFVAQANEDEARQVAAGLIQLGTLEFAILANQRDHAILIDKAKSSPDKEVTVEGVTIAVWRPIAPSMDVHGMEIPNPDFAEDDSTAMRQIANQPVGFREILVLYEADPKKRITGQLLTRADRTMDSNGRPAVGFHFNQTGAYLFADLTTRYKPHKDGSKCRLAVLLNDEVYTAPSINQPIQGNGIIESSRFTPREVDALVNVLNAGSLTVPVQENPIRVVALNKAPDYHLDTRRLSAAVLCAVAAVLAAVVGLMTVTAVWLITLKRGREGTGGESSFGTVQGQN